MPRGCAVNDRKLVIIPAEAKTVRSMFARYLELPSVRLLEQERSRADKFQEDAFSVVVLLATC